MLLKRAEIFMDEGQGMLILEFGVTLTVWLFLYPWDHFVIRGQSASTKNAAHGWHRDPTDEIH